MGMSERSPLMGSTEHTPYVFMTDPKRAYMKRVRQLQCYLCSAIVGIFALALIVSLVYSVDNDEEDIDVTNGSLALSLHLTQNQPGMLQDGINGIHLKKEAPVYEETDDISEELNKIVVPSSTVDENNDPCWQTDIKIACSRTAYRLLNGRCNNLNHPLKWGVSRQPLKRLIPSDYCDGVSSPRCDLTKGKLPSPALLSSKINNLDNIQRKNTNVIRTLWGQFIYQDLVSFSDHTVFEEERRKESCCEQLNVETSGDDDAKCYPIEISKDDVFFSRFNSTCIGYKRTDSILCASNNGSREQLNKVTSFLDGSALYGSTDKLERKLRKFSNGHLALYITSDYRFLPLDHDVNVECRNFTHYCTDEGFKCINPSMDLPSFSLMMARQHNLIASQLSTINPHWSDEKLYQETRRIITAQIQHITYNEYLDTVLDSEVIKTLGSSNAMTGYYEEYSDNVDASISNAFASAAFKLVHSFLPENDRFPDQSGKAEHCNLRLVAHHIQRGRDHGLPGYAKWRGFCNLKKPTTFDDLAEIMEADAVNVLKESYKNVEDIDLFVGALAETPMKDSSLGPVASCIIGDQFRRLKIGDRYWYETSEMPQLFNREQLAEIHKTTLSKIICDNSAELNAIQYNIMKQSDATPTLLCSTLPSLNLSQWDDSISAMPNVFQSSSGNKLEQVEQSLKKSYMESASNYIVEKSSKPTNVTKLTTSFTVNIANITAKIGNDIIYENANARPPITMPLDSVVDLSAYTPSATVKLMASSEDDILQGMLSVPLKAPTDTFNREKRILEANFTLGVTVKWGGTLVINPKKTYTCKVMFQSYAKLPGPLNSPNPTRQKREVGDDSNEQCNILMVGTFYQRPFYCPVTPWWCLEGKIFYWSGEAKLIFIKPNVSPQTNLDNSITKKKFTVGTSKSESLMEDRLVKSTNMLGKSDDDVVVKKTFASVTVLRGKISGQFNGEETQDIMNGSPPIDIYLDNFINPNSFDVSLDATWSATPVDDSSIVGRFSIPYFPEVGSEYMDRKSFSANFTVDIIYKYGGSIGIIDPSKTYTCKVMFQGNKKSSGNQRMLATPSSSTTIKGKTPFGESCSITISGSFYEPSVLCYITPWWCSKDKIFQWYGDIELALKYKYNSSEVDENGVPLKKYSLTTQDDQAISNYYGGGYRLGGKVNSGWITYKTGGLFSGSETLWSGSLPFEIKFPIFWTPSSKNDTDLSNVYGHALLWKASIFHSTIQGSFSFPQFVGHSSPPSVKWISGKFSFLLDLDYRASLYDLILPGVQYQSNIYFHSRYSPDDMPPFITPQRGDSGHDDAYSGIRAPIILLGKYAPDHKSFIWNGTFVWVITRTAQDLVYG